MEKKVEYVENSVESVKKYAERRQNRLFHTFHNQNVENLLRKKSSKSGITMGIKKAVNKEYNCKKQAKKSGKGISFSY